MGKEFLKNNCFTLLVKVAEYDRGHFVLPIFPPYRSATESLQNQCFGKKTLAKIGLHVNYIIMIA